MTNSQRPMANGRLALRLDVGVRFARLRGNESGQSTILHLVCGPGL